MKTFRFFALSVASLFFAGCGGDGRPALVPVSGQVTLNGEPLSGATVGFVPQDIPDYQRPSSATTDSSGLFKVGTYGSDDGIPEGTYKVTVAKTEIVGKVPDDFNEEEPDANARPIKTMHIVPRMYNSPDESRITVTVTGDGLDPDVIALEGDPEQGSSGPSADDP